MKFLARLLDRLSWPVLVAAGVALVAVAALLSISVQRAETPIREVARIVREIKPPFSEPAPPAPPAPEASPPAPASAPGSVPAPAPPPTAKQRATASNKSPAALPTPMPPDADMLPPMPQMSQIPPDLQERIRKRVHDELVRVQKELERAQKDALAGHEEARRDAEQQIREAQNDFESKQRDADAAIREINKEYENRRKEIKARMLAEMKEAARQKNKFVEADGSQSQGCVIENGTVRCQFKKGPPAPPSDLANRLRDIDQEERSARKEFEDQRREIMNELHDGQAEAQRTIDQARQEIVTQVAILGDAKTYKAPNIKIPDLKLPDIVLAPVPAPAKPVVPAPPVAPAAQTATAAPPAPVAGAAPLSQDAMLIVERDVGTVVADTLGEELHSALKGYRLALGGLLIGVALLLFSGAVIGKTVLTSNRAARARADLLRVEAERNLMSKQVVEAQLKMMQAQVEPHFLFNTLANVRFLLESNAAGAGTMLDHLIDYLHAALPQMREGSTTLGKEAELARAYLEILRIRMGSRLDFAINLPDALQGVSFPPMMLLSLVENAIKHGLEPVREGGRVDIEARAENGALKLAVKDTGAGFGAADGSKGGRENTDEGGTGVGLANIRARLKTLYGESATLTLGENQPHGVVATIGIPYG